MLSLVPWALSAIGAVGAALLLWRLAVQKGKTSDLGVALEASNSRLAMVGAKLVRVIADNETLRTALTKARYHEIDSSTPAQLVLLANELHAHPPEPDRSDILPPGPSALPPPGPSSNDVP